MKYYKKSFTKLNTPPYETKVERTNRIMPVDGRNDLNIYVEIDQFCDKPMEFTFENVMFSVEELSEWAGTYLEGEYFGSYSGYESAYFEVDGEYYEDYFVDYAGLMRVLFDPRWCNRFTSMHNTRKFFATFFEKYVK